MRSTEKVFMALEHMADADDDQLREAIPIALSPTTIRMAIGGVISSGQIPEDPAELDEFLTKVAGFCLSMRSDDYEPATV